MYYLHEKLDNGIVCIDNKCSVNAAPHAHAGDEVRMKHDLSESNLELFTGRNPSTLHMMTQLVPNRNLPQQLKSIAEECYNVGHTMAFTCPDGPELTTGLRKLLEAKDCFIRASLDLKPIE